MADDDGCDLYGDLEGATPLLPSAVELRNRLSAATERRVALEAHLQELQAEGHAAREAIKDLTPRMCVLLATARLELKRKHDQLTELGITPLPDGSLPELPESAPPPRDPAAQAKKIVSRDPRWQNMHRAPSPGAVHPLSVENTAS